jgi:hypothetical protein
MFGAPPPSPAAAFEVERKFLLSEKRWREFKEEVESVSLCPPKLTHLEDTYFDRESDCCLLENSIWLRKRGQQFELKIPTFGSGKRQSGATVYEEIEGLDLISSRLVELFPDKLTQLSPERFDEEFKPFASFSSDRWSYRLDAPDGFPLSLDFDEASFSGDIVRMKDRELSQYFILEIEGICAASDDIPHVESAIGKLAAYFGISARPERARGKLEEFLKRFRPDLYKRLVKT